MSLTNNKSIVNKNEICLCCNAPLKKITFKSSLGTSSLCVKCGSIKNQVAEPIGCIYVQNYYETNYIPIREQQLSKFSSILKNAQSIIPTRRVLDIGCGTGLFLKAACNLGYKLNVGIEGSKAAIEIAEKELLDTDTQIVCDKDSIVGTFGIIALLDSIGHVHDIESLLKSLIANNLEENGVILIRTPFYSKLYFYYGFIVAYLFSILGKAKLASSRIFNMPARLQLFTPVGLETLLLRCGVYKLSIAIECEYKRQAVRPAGVVETCLCFLTKWLPNILFGRNKSILYIARKINNYKGTI